MKRKLLWLVLCLLVSFQTVYGQAVPELSAEGVILLEPKTNTVLISKNGQQKFYPASITKILTAYILLEQMDGRQVITKSKESINDVPQDSSHIGLRVGERYSFMDGLYGLLLGSDNFVAYDLAKACSGSIKSFAGEMNRVAKALGATQSNFVNPHGYHDANHYTTPYDMAQIAKGAFSNPILRKITGTSRYDLALIGSGKSLTVKNTAKVIQSDSQYYNPHIVSVKTGYHSKASQTIVAMAEYPEITLIAVVMKTNSPNQYKDLNKLFEYGAANYSIGGDEKGGYRLNNRTASAWARPYVIRAEEKQWLSDTSVNYTMPITKEGIREVLEHALPFDRLALIGNKLENMGKTGTFTREQFGRLIEPLSTNQAQKLACQDPNRLITYEEVICIVCQLII